MTLGFSMTKRGSWVKNVAVPDARISTRAQPLQRLATGLAPEKLPADLDDAQRHAQADGQEEVVGRNIEGEEQTVDPGRAAARALLRRGSSCDTPVG